MRHIRHMRHAKPDGDFEQRIVSLDDPRGSSGELASLMKAGKTVSNYFAKTCNHSEV